LGLRIRISDEGEEEIKGKKEARQLACHKLILHGSNDSFGPEEMNHNQW
jgi:hypothetical protein